MDDNEAKILSLFALLGLTVLFGLIPWTFLASGSRPITGGRYRRAGVSLANCFAGGIFLGTCLLHLLPNVRNKYRYVLCRKNSITDYPLAELTVAIGFFIVLIFEQVVLVFHKPRRRHQRSTREVPPNGCNRQPSCHNCVPESNENRPVRETLSSGSVQISESVLSVESGASSTNGPVGTDPAERQDQTSIFSVEIGDDDLEVELLMRKAGRQATIRALLLLAALSLHSLFEGLALGLQNTTSDVLTVFAAVVLHKSVLAFSLGVRLMKAKSSLARIVKAIFVLAIMSPIGASIGIVVSSSTADTTSRETATAVLQGIATGTFLFVTFFEILTVEIKDQAASDIQMAKVGLAVLGFVAVAAMRLRSEDGGGVAQPCQLKIELSP